MRKWNTKIQNSQKTNTKFKNPKIKEKNFKMGHFSPPPADRVDVPAGLNSQEICLQINWISSKIDFNARNSILKHNSKAFFLGRTKSLPHFGHWRPLIEKNISLGLWPFWPNFDHNLTFFYLTWPLPGYFIHIFEISFKNAIVWYTFYVHLFVFENFIIFDPILTIFDLE